MTTPISPITKLYAVEDAKIAPLTADPAGGVPTYGALLDVPGIKSMEITGDMDTKSLRGDNGLIDSDTVLTNVQVAVTHAKMSLAVLAALLGGDVVNSGADPAQMTSWDLTKDSKPAPFLLEGVTPASGGDVIGGDVHFRLWKCKLSGFPAIGFAEEDYRIVSFNATALPLLSTGKWLTPTINQTATPIALPA